MSSNQSKDAFLLGLAYSAISHIQTHLIKNETREALTVTNEAMRILTPAIDAEYYTKEEKNEPV